MATLGDMTTGTDSGDPAPFGQIEGAYAEIKSVRSGYIEFDASYGGLSIRPEDQDVRIIIGRMGTGKSLNLRRLFDYNNKELQSDVYTAGYSSQAGSTLTTNSVRYFCEAFDRHNLTENWKLLWQRAIVRATITHLLYSETLTPYTRHANMPTLRSRHRLLSDQGIPTDIATEAQLIIQTAVQRNPRAPSDKARLDLSATLEANEWVRIEYEALQCLRECPPIYFYIDAIDDEFRAAPSYWLRAQKGLFYQIYTLLRRQGWRERLHVVAGIRDFVLSSVLQGEHGHKYINEPHHRVLKWTPDSIRVFLRRKIADLDDRWLINPGADTEVECWLGYRTILNRSRNIVEDLEDYLIRHTRLTPRDIVQLGNRLCLHIKDVKARGESSVDPDSIRAIVAACAADNARFELAHCANQVDSDLGRLSTTTPRYRGSQEYDYNDTVSTMERLIGDLSSDRFERSSLEMLRQRARDLFADAEIDLASVLWQNGLLGYSRPGRSGIATNAVFYFEPSVGSATVPASAEYVLHPVLLDAIPALDASGPPVFPVPASSPL